MMYEQDKSMQYCFYIGVLVFFIFGFCYFGTSHIDGRRSEDIGARIDDCQNLNSELQAGNSRIEQKVDDSQREVESVIRGLGNAEKELDRAECAVDRCQQIIATAKRRTQEASKTDK